MATDLDAIRSEIQQLDDRLAEVIEAIATERAVLAEARELVLVIDGMPSDQQAGFAAHWGMQRLVTRDRIKKVRTRLGGFARMIG